METKERHGVGAIVWNDGSTYQGYWVGGQPEGPGRMVIYLLHLSNPFPCLYFKYRFMLTEEFLRDGSRKEIYMDTEHTQAKKLKVGTNKFLKNLVMLNPQKNAKTIILETGVMV